MKKSGNKIQSVENSLDIFDLIIQSDGVRLNDLTEELGMPKSTAHRYLSTMKSKGYLVQEENTYRISGKFIQFAEQVYNRHPAYPMIAEKVEELAAETGELVQFLIEEHHQAVYVFQSVGQKGIKIDTKKGSTGPLHSTAGGKAILSTWPESAIRAFCDSSQLPQITPSTITDQTEFQSELETVRDRGYAINDQENIEGVRAVAVPIGESGGRAFGAISISGPINRIKGDLLEKELPDLLLGVSNELELNFRFI